MRKVSPASPKHYRVKFDREVDGRWIASVGKLPGCHAYGGTKAEAATKAQALALHYLAFALEDRAAAIRRTPTVSIRFGNEE